MYILSRIPVPNDHFGPTLEYRSDKVRDPLSRILIVPIGIYYDVSSEHQSVHDPMMKSDTQTSVGFEFDDMMDSELPRYLRGSIGAPIIDDEVFDDINSWYVIWEISKSDRQSMLFVFAGNLDDELCHIKQLFLPFLYSGLSHLHRVPSIS